MNNTLGYVAYQLKELMRERLIASVFTDPNNPDDFIAGFVLKVNGRTALVNAVSPYGQMDGYFGIRLATVLEVQYDAVYAERLGLLMRMGGQQIEPLPIREEDDALKYLLELAGAKNRAVTVWTASESYTGFVSEVNDLFLSLEPVDFMGRRCCPNMSLRLADIEMVSIGSEEERMYESLERYHQKQGG